MTTFTNLYNIANAEQAYNMGRQNLSSAFTAYNAAKRDGCAIGIEAATYGIQAANVDFLKARRLLNAAFEAYTIARNA